MEINVNLKLPGIPEAINRLADALSGYGPVRIAPAIIDTPKAVLEAETTQRPAEAAQDTPPWQQPTPGAEHEADAVTTTVQTPPAPAKAKPKRSLDEIARMGTALMDAGKIDALLALLAKYGVQAITELKSEQYDAIAADLDALF